MKERDFNKIEKLWEKTGKKWLPPFSPFAENVFKRFLLLGSGHNCGLYGKELTELIFTLSFTYK